MSAPPLCRCCGKPLPKKVTTHYPPKGAHFFDGPMSKEDCQALSNETVVSVAYHHNGRSDGVRQVRRFGTWDGESYDSVYGQGFFCTLRCAADFAAAFARRGDSTAAYVAALTKQRNGE
jgi:hypothetical protein